MSPKVDLVVVNRRTPGDLARFLDSISERIDLTVAVVNVEPEDTDLKVAADFKEAGGPYSWVRTLAFADNVGYNVACNVAAAMGSAETIALFNADVTLTPHAVELCAEALWSEPRWGILGPRQTDHQHRVIGAGIIGPARRPRHRAWRAPDRPQYRDIRDDCVFVMGSALFIRRAVWDELDRCPTYRAVTPDAGGPMLETKHWWGDTYLGQHAVGHDWSCVYYGPIQIFHDVHGADPHLSFANKNMRADRQLFRDACDAHGLEHD